MKILIIVINFVYLGAFSIGLFEALQNTSIRIYNPTTLFFLSLLLPLINLSYIVFIKTKGFSNIRKFFCIKKLRNQVKTKQPTKTRAGKMTKNEDCLNRIRGFQNNLITWWITWNIALIGFVLFGNPSRYNLYNSLFPYIPLITAFVLNVLVAIIYRNEHNIKMKIENKKGIGTTYRCLIILWILIQLFIFLLFRMAVMEKGVYKLKKAFGMLF